MSWIGWKYPPREWMKLNVDDSRKGNSGCSGADGLIRDSDGS